MMLCHFCDNLDFHQGALRQGLDGHSRTGGIRLSEEFRIDGVHIGEVVHIGQEYRRLHNVSHCETCLFKNRLDVGERLACLFFNASCYKNSSSGEWPDYTARWQQVPLLYLSLFSYTNLFNRCKGTNI